MSALYLVVWSVFITAWLLLPPMPNLLLIALALLFAGVAPPHRPH